MPRGGLGSDAAVEGLLSPCDVAAVGSNQLCGMGVMRQNVLNLAVVDTKKSSPMDSVSMHRKRVQRTRFSLQRNRVLRTRFLSIETESFGLVFCVRFFLESH